MTHLTDEMRAQGWVEHRGDKCPVQGHQRVSVMLGNGVRTTSYFKAEIYRWDQDRPIHDFDIIAYRMEPSQ